MEDFVDFSLAVKLKEKGFDWETSNVYERNTLACRYVDYPKPTISQVLKWLREEKKIYVSILPLTTHSTINKVAFYYLIEYNSTGETITSIEPNNYCVEWKDAAVAGIFHVLDKLI